MYKRQKLPSKEVLLAKIMGSMNSPITNLVFVLNGTVQALATVLQRHVEKAEETPAAEEKVEEAPAAEEKVEEAPAAEEKVDEASVEENTTEEK